VRALLQRDLQPPIGKNTSSPVTPTAMCPFTMKTSDPIIRFSSTSPEASMIARTRSASSGSYAMRRS